MVTAGTGVVMSRSEAAFAVVTFCGLDRIPEDDRRSEQHASDDERDDDERRHHGSESERERNHEECHRQRNKQVADPVGEQRPLCDLGPTDTNRINGGKTRPRMAAANLRTAPTTCTTNPNPLRAGNHNNQPIKISGAAN